MKNIPESLIKDILGNIKECSGSEYFGALTIRLNIQGGNIRNVNYTTERSKKYD